MQSPTSTAHSDNDVGAMLRRWRAARGLSQLELAMQSGVTQKHVSFVENGRSAPSRPLLLRLARALEVPLRDRNSLLLAAGFAPAFAQEPSGQPTTPAVANAVQRMLRQHEPFPAVVMDRHWNVLSSNEAAPRFFSCFVDLHERPAPRNLLHLMFDPAGMRPYVENWSEASQGLLDRVRREAVGHVVDIHTRSLLESLYSYPAIERVAATPELQGNDPVVALSFRKHGVTLRYFSLITTVGTPRTVATDELRLECMFPADEPTEHAHERFVQAYAR
jgi:transcriptional regulator with XRE-family HTH domain